MDDELDIEEIEGYANAWTPLRVNTLLGQLEQHKNQTIPPQYDHAQLFYSSPLADAATERIQQRIGIHYHQVTFVDLQQIIACEINDAEDQNSSLPRNVQEKNQTTINRLRHTEEILLNLITFPETVFAQDKHLIKTYINHQIDRNAKRKEKTTDEAQAAKFQSYENIFGSFYEKLSKLPIPKNPEIQGENPGSRNRIQPPNR